jgi:hypothetical protein
VEPFGERLADATRSTRDHHMTSVELHRVIVGR